MALSVDELAAQIASLDESDQEALFERVAELNFKRGFDNLAQKYQRRLAAQGVLNKRAEDVLVDLRKIREKVAVDEYQK